MNWRRDYEKKLCSAAEAVRGINAQAHVYMGGNTATPRAGDGAGGAG